METLERFISELDFFKGFPEKFINLIYGCASNVVLKQGEYFCHEGENVTHFYAVRSGKVAIDIPYPGRGNITIQTIGPGEVFGWGWLFHPYQSRFSARVQSDVRAFAFDGTCLRNKLEENHHLGYELIQRFAYVIIDRLEASRRQLIDVCTQPENMIFAE